MKVLTLLLLSLATAVSALQRRQDSSSAPASTSALASVTRSRASVTTSTTSVASSASPDSYLKFMFSRSATDSYYNMDVDLNGQQIPFRLDVLQPDLWILNGNSMLLCAAISTFYSEHSTELNWESVYLTYSEVRATDCGRYLMYTTAESPSAPLATVANVSNGLPWSIAYVDRINATGEWTTIQNLTVDSVNGVSVLLNNMTIGDADSTNVVVGGFGLASGPEGSGFLDSLVGQGFIGRSAYSLFFHGLNADLIPGVVDSSLFDGDFISYDILPHVGSEGKDTTLVNRLSHMTFPTVLLQDVSVRNTATNQIQSLMSGTGSSSDIPVILHTRSSYLYLPLDIIVNLAIQTNAVYISDLSNWIVGCDLINGSNAQLEFSFPDLTIKVPIRNILSNAYDDDYNQIVFSDGSRACYLNVVDNTGTGVTSLGLPFLSQVYMAVDNVSGKVALGQANNNLLSSSAASASTASSSSSSSSSTAPKTTLQSLQNLFQSQSTYAYFENSSIPYATYHLTSAISTLTYFLLNSLASLEIPARFTSALLSLGSIYFTQTLNITSLRASLSSVSNSTRNGAQALMYEGPFSTGWIVPFISLLMSLLMM